MNQKILIIGPAWVGDMVMAQTLFQQLKRQNSDVVIDVAAPAWTNSLLERMPEVNRSIALPFKHGEFALAKRYRLGRQLKAENYSQAIVLPNSFKSALVPFFARIPKRTGWRGEMRYGLLNDVRVLDKAKYPLMIQRVIALAFPKDAKLPAQYLLPKLVVDQHSIQKAFLKLGLNELKKPMIALCPGAEFGASKQWPVDYYGEVAKYYLEKGWEVSLFGSANDGSVASEIMRYTEQRCINLAGKTTLAEAIDLLSLSKLVVTNDSGLMHIAAALSIPLVAIYGSSSPKFTPPLGEKSKIVSINLNCSPCFKRECPLGHHRCMKELKPKLVLDELQSLVE